MEKQEFVAGLEDFTHQLEDKIKGISSGDFRFYNIARLPLLAGHSFRFAAECETCKNNIPILNQLVHDLPDSLSNFEERKQFEINRDSVTKHLQKKHKIRFANYHYSLYTFAGLLLGAVIGLLIQLFFQHRVWTILAVAGAAIGAIYGKHTEAKRRIENRLM